MAELMLFHHAQGQTEGFHAFADRLRQAGHTVHVPDLFDGRVFGSIDEGLAHVRDTGGFENLIERGVRPADDLPAGLVHGGFSMGVLRAQKLAQTRPGARGAALLFGRPPVRVRRGMASGRRRRALPLPTPQARSGSARPELRQSSLLPRRAGARPCGWVGEGRLTAGGIAAVTGPSVVTAIVVPWWPISIGAPSKSV
jgi:hypothetical protein